LDPQLLDDFFAEADEHLLRIRVGLERLDSSVGKPQPDLGIVKELFGQFHSLKGICALIGLGSAEAVAHRTEDCLRLMRDGQSQLSAGGLEVLSAAARKLEQIIAAFGTRKPIPEHESVLALISEACSSAPAPETPPKPAIDTAPTDLTERVDKARADGKLLWVYRFTPTKELHSAGVNVNSVREELSSAGEILKATPQVKGQQALSFEFLVATTQAPSDLSAWQAKGVAVAPCEDAPGAPPDSSVNGASEGSDQNPFLAPSHVVRVDLKHLDELMRITGELVIHRFRLETQLTKVNGPAGRVDLSGVQEVSGGLARSLKELRKAIMRVRLVPVAEIFARMPFVVRDLATETRKKAKLRLEGQDTAIDKFVIERLKDPLLHLVRNAFSHGVETAEARAAAGKPEEATIELSARTAGDSVIIQIKDDGRGISHERIVERARKLGAHIPSFVDDQAILQVICAPGFSTRQDADRASGRGVGMTVVQAAIRELGGNLTLETEEGRGTQFTIRLPLTLAIADTLIVAAAGQKCAIPQSFVREIVHANETDVQTANGIEVIPYRDGILPIIRLAKMFRLASRPKASSCVLVVSSERGSVGLLTEEVLGQREVVVSALRDPLIQVPGISGATELGDGKPVLILDAATLTAGSVRPPEPEGAQ
jgi:two-component system chemotaxis sensor kinase CheA